MKKNKGGRPSKYDPKFCQEIIKFFSKSPYKGNRKFVANDLPFFSAFARKIGVNTDTLDEWQNVHPEFSEAYKKAKELQEEFLVMNGLKGLYNSTAFVFTMKNVCKWRDVNEHYHSGGLTLTVEQENAIRGNLRNGVSRFAPAEKN